MDADSLLQQATLAHTNGALADAERLYRQVLDQDQANLHALFLLGILYIQAGRFGDAVPLLERLLELNPAHAETAMHLALAYREGGDTASAERCYLHVLDLAPADTQAHFNLAELYQSLGRFDESLDHYRQAARLDASLADALFNQGVIHYTRKNFSAAEACYREFLDLRPSSVEANYNLGAVLQDLGRFGEAVDFYRRALALKPSLSDAYRGIGNIRMYERDYGAAEENFRNALAISPDDVELLNNRGVVLQKLNRLEEAEACFRRATSLAPEHVNAHFNLALVLLLQGNFAEGWPEYEWRLRIKNRVQDDLGRPEWDGSDLAGRTILVRAEQGFGDTFQFVRYLPMVKARGGRVVFECQHGLQRLLRGVRGVDEIVQKTATGKVLAQFETHIPLLSLPRIFHTDLANIPTGGAYLFPAPWLVERWRERLAAERSFKVGFVWAGRPTHEDDRNRSIVLADFFRLAEIPGVRWFSLQKGAAASQLEQLPLGAAVVNLDEELADFADTAAAISNLDLVISVDTSVAHLAGALGKPVWVLLPFSPDWRWMTGRDDSPWYPSMRLFRQQYSGGWPEVFERVEMELRAAVAAWRPAEIVDGATYSLPVIRLLALARHALKRGDSSAALEACGQLAAEQPEHPESNYLRGLAHLQRGEYEKAAACLGRAAVVWPEHPEILKNLGIAMQSLNRLEEAADCYRAALACGNEEAETFYNLGSAYYGQSRFEDAAALFLRTLEYNPGFAEALNNLGLSMQRLGKAGDALRYFNQALEANPDFFDARLNLGNALIAEGRHAEAETAFRLALKQRPDSGPLYNNLGVALKSQGDFAGAIDSFRQALRIDPRYGEALNNLGNALKAMDDLDGAIAVYREALGSDPDNPTLLNNLGNTLQAAGQVKEALKCFNKAVALAPEFAEAHWNRAIALLLDGEYAEGWREYEWGFAAGQRPLAEFGKPRWNGAPLPGQTILVHAEQGFGDTFQFVRYLPLVKARCGQVILECQPALVEILKTVEGVDQVIPGSVPGQVDAAFDAHVPLMSLPVVFDTSLASIPSAIPYIRPDEARVIRWRQRLGEGGFKVGFVWAGRPAHENDRNRSCPLRVFLPLFELEGMRFYSLQKGDAAAELKVLGGAARIVDLSSGLDDFADTAAVIAGLDLVIAVDTAVAHLAGALGKPAWVMLPFAPDWRWLLERENSPWYPTMRLFRQDERGNWEGVMARICRRLERETGHG